MSLRARLVLAATYLLVVVVVALEVPFAVNIDRRAQKEFEAGLMQNAALVASRINDDVASAGIDPAEPLRPPTAIISIADATARATGARFVVTDRLGRVLADSAGGAAVGTLFGTADRPEFGSVFAVSGGQIDVRRRSADTLQSDLLLVTVPVIHNQEPIGAVRASVPLTSVDERVRRIWFGLAVIGLGVIAVGLALAWALATSLARPVRRLERIAGALGEGDLDARARVEGPKEIALLAGSFNEMAAALGANIRAQRDFLANASHQLRTPLTGLKLRLESIEGEGGPVAEQARKAGEEVDRLGSLVEDLLKLARASSVSSAGALVDPHVLAREAAERWSTPAESCGKRLRLDVHGEAAVWADPVDLRHILDNLIDNAVRYTPRGTDVVLRVERTDGVVRMGVSDTGPGIPPDERERVFERFFRGATGRRSGPGSGLGLAIVSDLALRWSGRVSMSNGNGTSIEAVFPAASRTAPSRTVS